MKIFIVLSLCFALALSRVSFKNKYTFYYFNYFEDKDGSFQSINIFLVISLKFMHWIENCTKGGTSFYFVKVKMIF